MKKYEKIAFIKLFLQNKFNSKTYLEFLKNILNIEISKIENINISNFFKIEEKQENSILSCKNLGSYSSEENEIALLQIKLSSELLIFSENEKTFISSFLKKMNYSHAIVVFYKEDSPNWRLSLIKNLNDINNIKRINYSLGEDALINFPLEQFSKLASLSEPPSIKNLDKSFSLEKFTNNFFEDYKKLYLNLKDYIETNKSSFSINSSEIQAKMFLEKIVLSYFLEKKGWNLQKEFYNFKEINIPDNFYFNSEKKGIFDIFNSYPFSIKENDTYEIELAVDPEMLGKVFENLLGIKDKRSKGTFYTPREIVEYISKETILHALLKAFKDVNKDMLHSFIFLGEFFAQEDKKKVSEFLKMPKFVRENPILLDNCLKNLKILDPSTGSGAFPVGILHEIVKIRKILTEYMDSEIKSSRTLFFLKKETIENSLYGIDIENHAVEITKLRLSLSLLADATEETDIFSKINFNFITANSLTEDLSKRKKWFILDGFDILIGNPPYVGEKGNKEIFRAISESSLGKTFYIGKSDLLYFFFHLGINLLKKDGILGFITTNYYLTADGAKKLREDLKERTNILKLINFNNLVIFEKARGQHNLVTLLEKSFFKNKELKTILCDKNIQLTLNDLDEIFSGISSKVSYHLLNSEEIFNGKNNYIRMEKDEITSILEKMKINSSVLKTFFSVKQGIVSGADKFSLAHKTKFVIDETIGKGIFILNEEELKNLNLNETEFDLIKPFYKNSDIFSYINNEIPKLWVIYLTKNEDLEDFPNIKKHLLKYKAILENKRETKTGKLPWYSLNWSRELSIFTSPKIVTRQRCKTNMFAYNESNWFSSADVYYINPKKVSNMPFNLKYILALLNSKLFFLWFYKYGKRKGELLELYSTPLEELPIKNVQLEIQNKISLLVDKILIEKKLGKNSDFLELEMNNLIYDIYLLTENDKKIVNNFTSLSV
ncbi:MAG: Eco57I restriction-modification methylase domain-containing protein [Fusobacteriaceae bacterium]